MLLYKEAIVGNIFFIKIICSQNVYTKYTNKEKSTVYIIHFNGLNPTIYYFIYQPRRHVPLNVHSAYDKMC